MRRRPRRSRRALAQGRADGHAGGIRARGDHGARGSARRLGVATVPRARRACRRQRRRHVEPAPRSAAARALSRSSRSSRCAATSTRGCASSTQGSTTAIILAAAGLQAAGPRASASRRCSIRPTACPRSGRARWRSSAAPTAPTCSRALAPLADRATTIATTAERAFGRVLAGDCRTPLAAYATWRGRRSCGCAGLSPAATASEVLRGERAAARARRRRGAREALGREALGARIPARAAPRAIARRGRGRRMARPAARPLPASAS